MTMDVSPLIVKRRRDCVVTINGVPTDLTVEKYGLPRFGENQEWAVLQRGTGLVSTRSVFAACDAIKSIYESVATVRGGAPCSTEQH